MAAIPCAIAQAYFPPCTAYVYPFHVSFFFSSRNLRTLLGGDAPPHLPPPPASVLTWLHSAFLFMLPCAPGFMTHPASKGARAQRQTVALPRTLPLLPTVLAGFRISKRCWRAETSQHSSRAALLTKKGELLAVRATRCSLFF